jgi:hypothetical protein
MKDKTKELADSVGAVYPVLFMGRHDGVLFTETELETFVALVAAAEREACAKVCDDEASRCEAAAERAEADEVAAIRSMAWKISVCAAGIRARGTT